MNWNSGSLLGRCLDCLGRQTFPPRRIVVVDNASVDDSIDQAKERHPHVQIIRLDFNAGFAHANNVAARAVPDCEWIALLNPDAFAEPTWLESLARAAQEQSEYSFFGSQMRLACATDRLDGIGDVYHVSGLYWRKGHGSVRTDDALTPSEIFSPCAAAALYRQDAFWEAGGFDASYFCYAEDVDLGFRLRLCGHRCRYVPEAVVDHVGSAVTGRASDFAVYHGHRNLVWTFFKDMPATLLWTYLPQHLLLNVVSLCRFAARGQARVIWSAKWDALRGLPRVWRARRHILWRRQVTSRELRALMATGWLTPYLAHARRDTHHRSTGATPAALPPRTGGG